MVRSGLVRRNVIPSIQLPWTSLNMLAILSITLRIHMTLGLTMATKHKTIYPMATRKFIILTILSIQGKLSMTNDEVG